MNRKQNRGISSILLSIVLLLAISYGAIAQVGAAPGGASITMEATTASMVNVHMGQTADTVYLTFAWPNASSPTVTVIAPDGTQKTFPSVAVTPNASGKNRFTAPLSGLSPGTTYEYVIGTGGSRGSFSTARTDGPFTFAFLTDPQVAFAADAKATGALFDQLNRREDLSFVYIAGDMTDSPNNESQWERLFQNGTPYENAGQTLFENHLLAVAQGNHDNATFSGHISAPSAGTDVGAVCYAFSYSNVRFIVLNMNNEKTRDGQAAFLTEQTQQAKAAGQWVFVASHQSLYSGASHVVNGHIVSARKFWSPLFAQLGVDVVLQGHDHVYARGFITGKGANANLKATQDGYTATAGVPLYMTGGESGAVKWYAATKYKVPKNDPLTPNYGFLDINSAVPSQNPWKSDTSKTKEQTYTIISVDGDVLQFNTYMMKYDGKKNTMTTAPYLYDSLTLRR